MNANRTEVAAGLALCGFCLFAWQQAAQLRSAAGMFPKAVIVLMGFFSVIYLLRSIFNGSATDALFQQARMFAVVLIGSVIYTLLVVTVGYVTSTVIFVPLISWMIGFRRPLYIAVTTVVYVATAYLLFEVVFERPMPDDRTIMMIRSLF